MNNVMRKSGRDCVVREFSFTEQLLYDLCSSEMSNKILVSAWAASSRSFL